MQHTDLLQDEHVRGIVLNGRDVSERKAFEDQLAHQAFHDPVTNLANRALFADRVEHALMRSSRGAPDDRRSCSSTSTTSRPSTTASVMRPATRSCRRSRRRLAGAVRPADTVARFGGDEFADPARRDQRLDRGRRRRRPRCSARSSCSSRSTASRSTRARASASASSTEELGSADAEELLRNADVAMYMAKRDSKGSYRVFEPAMHERVVERLELQAELQRRSSWISSRSTTSPSCASTEHEPTTASRRCSAGTTRRAAPIPPLQFIPLAEETGLIIPIGRWVLAARPAGRASPPRALPAPPPLTMSVNLSVKQLQSETIVDDVREALEATGLPPASLVLEITETVMMADTGLRRRAAARAEGARRPLAMDDFGTGYSSLSYLSRFPVDILKMDRSFLAPSTTSRRWRRRSSPSATASTSTSSPRASSCPSRSRRCAISAASSARASCSPSPMN